jgi:nitrite reductase (NADH) small subunit/3-phenylpropionate/trans-cinnamate dioxygenase ferredoxin subunit
MSEIAQGVRACRADEVGKGRALCVRLPRGLLVALARLDDDSIVAFENVCPHKAGPLGEGRIRDGAVACPWHGFRFDVRTGETVGVESIMRLRLFPVTIRDGEVYVMP